MVRVVSWNLNNRGITGARMQWELLHELKPDLMLLQEVNLGSAETLRQAAEADWLICAADLRQRAADDRPARSRGSQSPAADQPHIVPGFPRMYRCPSRSC